MTSTISTANLLDGTPVSLDEYRGRVLLVVNVASHCGYTPQYGASRRCIGKHKDAGSWCSGSRATSSAPRNRATSDEIASSAAATTT